MARRAYLQTAIIGILVGIGCIALVLRQVDLKRSWSSLAHLNGPYLIVPFVVFLLNLPLRALRWQLIFPSASRPRLWNSLLAIGIGNMANFLLPARAGDIARCVLLGDETVFTESSRALATLVVEKVLDGFALVAIVFFAVWSIHPPVWVLRLVEVAACIFGAAMVSLMLLRYRTERLVTGVERLLELLHLHRLAEKAGILFESFTEGLGAITSGQQMPLLFLLTAGIWLSEALLIWGLAHTLDLDVSVKSAVVASAILGLSLMIPAAPGGLGTYELFGTEAFKLGGLTASAALALTAATHAWVYIANIGTGACLLSLKGINLAYLRKQVGRVSSTAQPSA